MGGRRSELLRQPAPDVVEQVNIRIPEKLADIELHAVPQSADYALTVDVVTVLIS